MLAGRPAGPPVMSLGDPARRRHGKLAGSVSGRSRDRGQASAWQFSAVLVAVSPARLAGRLQDEIQSVYKTVRDLAPGNAGLEVFERFDGQMFRHAWLPRPIGVYNN